MYGVLAVELPDVEDADNVVALEPRARPRLAEEARARRGRFLRPLGYEDLDGARLEQRDVPRLDDDARTPAREDPFDLVLPAHDLANADR